MKRYLLFLIFLITCNFAKAQINCNNVGFDDSTFTNWVGKAGNVPGTVWTTGIITNGANAAYNDPLARHTINTSATRFDTLAYNSTLMQYEIPLVAPGGSTASVRLGNANTGSETEKLNYVYYVNPSNTVFTYQFAIVLEDSVGHTAIESPRFDVRVLDSLGNPFGGPCGLYSINAFDAATDPQFQPFNMLGHTGYYKKWTAAAIDLSSVLGHYVVIEFQTSDCTTGGHFGYAYIDATCNYLHADVSFCQGDTIATLSVPPTYAHYQWYDQSSAAMIGDTNNVVQISHPIVGQHYTVAMVAVTGCGSSIMVTLTSDVTSFTMAPDSANAFTYHAFNISSGNGSTYLWDFGDGSPPSTAVSPMHTYAIAGTYNVCLTHSSTSCNDSVCHNVVVTGVASPCLALFDATHDSLSSNPNGYIVTNLSYGSTLTYFWDFGDGTNSSLPLPTHTYPGIGPYYLCLTVNNGSGCTQTYCDSLHGVDSLGHAPMHPVVINVVDGPTFGTVGIPTIANPESSISLSPNPATSTLTITNQQSSISSIHIYSVLGEMVYQSSINNNQSMINISVSSLTNGMYFIEATTDKGIVRKKFIKQ